MEPREIEDESEKNEKARVYRKWSEASPSGAAPKTKEKTAG